jgi:predicted exporter
VTALDSAKKRLPGIRHLGVVVDTGAPENAPAALRFLSALEARVTSYPPELASAAQSGIEREREFLETYALQLMDPADVRKLREAVEARKRWELNHALGTSLLDEAEDPAPVLPVQEMLDKYGADPAGAARFPGDRFVSEDARTAVLVIQAGSQGTSMEQDEALLERVRQDIRAQGFPAAYAAPATPPMRVGYAGDVATRFEEAHGLVLDLGISGVVVMGLVLSALALFYGSLAAWPVLVFPIVLGTLYTFALVALPPLGIRSLNANTAFLASIILGNGINAGVILLARVQEHSRAGQDLESSLNLAVKETAWPTLAAALAAAGAYASLTLTDFRGFRQFGWIGGLGLVLCWATTYVLSPVLVQVFSRSLLRARRLRLPSISGSIARLVMGRPRGALALMGVLALGALLGIARRHADWLETDFSRLRRADSFVSGERYWGQRMDQTLHRYLTPTVVMTDSAAEAARVAEAIRHVAAGGHAGGLIASVRSSTSVLPETRHAALAEARLLAGALTSSTLAALKPDERTRVERLLSDKALTPITPQDVPPALAVGLRDTEGRLDRNVLVFPVLSNRTWDAERIAAYAHDLRSAAHAASPTAIATGPLLLSSDIIDAMRRDGPRTTAVAFATAVIVTLLAFRSWQFSLLAIVSIVLGVLLMLGGAAWVGQRINFSNLIALPITFGIAADYSINVLKRYQEGASIEEAVANTGGAVALCSVTTVVGYGSLLMAENQALFSFGALAVAGELACLFTALLVVPAFLVWRAQSARHPFLPSAPLAESVKGVR